MKNLFTIIIICLLWVACGKSNEESNIIIPHEDVRIDNSLNFFNCHFEGEAYQASSMQVYAIIDYEGQANTISILSSIDQSSDMSMVFTMTIPNNLELGEEYVFDGEAIKFFVQDAGIEYSPIRVFGGNGSLIITERTDEEIEGAFSLFLGISGSTEVLEVSEGSFRIQYK